MISEFFLTGGVSGSKKAKKNEKKLPYLRNVTPAGGISGRQIGAFHKPVFMGALAGEPDFTAAGLIDPVDGTHQAVTVSQGAMVGKQIVLDPGLVTEVPEHHA